MTAYIEISERKARQIAIRLLDYFDIGMCIGCFDEAFFETASAEEIVDVILDRKKP